MSNKSYFFSLSLSYAECENLYITGINSVVVTADSGERVQLPSKNLRPFVQRSGLSGRFRLVVSDQQKVVSLDKIA